MIRNLDVEGSGSRRLLHECDDRKLLANLNGRDGHDRHHLHSSSPSRGHDKSCMEADGFGNHMVITTLVGLFCGWLIHTRTHTHTHD